MTDSVRHTLAEARRRLEALPSPTNTDLIADVERFVNAVEIILHEQDDGRDMSD